MFDGERDFPCRVQNAGNVWRGTEHMLTLEIQDGRLRHSDQ